MDGSIYVLLYVIYFTECNYINVYIYYCIRTHTHTYIYIYILAYVYMLLNVYI